MSLMNEYINKSGLDLQKELSSLISQYNKLRQTYLLVYASATETSIPAASLSQADFYTIHDLLSHKSSKNIDVYIETRGGSGEAAEEIVRFLHNNFETVSFVISGEAKSAGTIVVLSGDNILMTETGSLGPIDAQIKIGRSMVSASDYIDWIEEKREAAKKDKSLNPLDATIVAQISPGELAGALHALKFAEDLVVEWLPIHKFKDWKVTETREKPVTLMMKKARARSIAQKLTNHKKWRSHGKSIKIKDLIDDIKLKIDRVDDNPQLADIVYRIQIVCRMLFSNSTTFKIFATQDNKIFNQAVERSNPTMLPPGFPGTRSRVPDMVKIEPTCTKCGVKHRIGAILSPNPRINEDLRKQGLTAFPKNDILKCQCGFEIDLSGVKNKIEMDFRRKIIK